MPETVALPESAPRSTSAAARLDITITTSAVPNAAAICWTVLIRGG